MTLKQLKKVPFHLVDSLSMANEHIVTYASSDGHIGFCIHTPKKNDFTFGKPFRTYRIGSNIYETWEAFIEALKTYRPNVITVKFDAANKSSK